ncbi:MAG TPA: hypothetical protein VKK31_15820 [Thermoanaerobaculia bacterium]|nr:hypothetical protein [Thermoanaerobaculia bacterium]
MAQFKAFQPGVEVYGAVVLSVTEGMGEFRTMAERILAQHGIVKPQPDTWYPQQAWLDSFKTISEQIGPRTLFAIGKKILDTVGWPAWIDGLETGMRAIDLNYHLRHRLDGVPMLNDQTGELTPGIGHYELKGLTADNSAVMVCNNPYPSELDRGIITAMGRRFESSLEVRLDTTQPTRTQGADSCTYIIEW